MLCYTLGVGREVKSASIDRTQIALKHGVPLQLSDRSTGRRSALFLLDRSPRKCTTTGGKVQRFMEICGDRLLRSHMDHEFLRPS
jgi:hypothetical protein